MLQKLYMLETLREVEGGARTLDWFEGKVPSIDDERTDATKELMRIGFIEKVDGYPQRRPHPFCLTDLGHDFLRYTRAKIGNDSGGIDWVRIAEIEFSSFQEEFLI